MQHKTQKKIKKHIVINAIGGREIIDSIINPNHGKISEKENACASFVEGSVCANKAGIKKLREYYSKKSGNPISSLSGISDEELINRLKQMLGVQTEMGVIENTEVRSFLGQKMYSILRNRLKPIGPKNTTNLLNNFNIDECLSQWALEYSRNNPKNKSGRYFYHVPFQMMDFATTMTELAAISFPKLIKNGYNCFGVVVNTDYSTGPGKHWFALYGDFTSPGTIAQPWSLEFFNSSGRKYTHEIYLPIQKWLMKTGQDIEAATGKKVVIMNNTKQFQEDRHSCGPYSLAYIRSRLEGKSRDWFLKNKIGDEQMVYFRKIIFNDEGGS